jgi:hypothetical protein
MFLLLISWIKLLVKLANFPTFLLGEGFSMRTYESRYNTNASVELASKLRKQHNFSTLSLLKL